ncbi:MAG: hypothetical protein AAGA48_20870 [Myxococcota bacterium]
MEKNLGSLLRRLSDTDPLGAAWCTALCAWTRHHLLPSNEYRPATLFRLVMLSAQGVPVSRERLGTAAFEACDAVAAYAQSSASGSWDAAYAANAAANGVYDVRNHAIAYIAACAARVTDDIGFAEMPLLRLVEHQLTPLAHPGHLPIGDWLLERNAKPGRVGTLGASLSWARQHHLRWWAPAQRWAAEHRILPPSELLRRLRGRA